LANLSGVGEHDQENIHYSAVRVQVFRSHVHTTLNMGKHLNAAVPQTESQPQQPRGDSGAQQQWDISRERERQLYAAATQNYTIRIASTGEAFNPASTPYGTTCVVSWRDPRPAQVDSTYPASGEEQFDFWDTPTLAVELDSLAASDPGRRQLLGSWLYIAHKGEGQFFWSMIVHFHRTGRCLPAHEPRGPEPDTVYEHEVERIADSAKALASTAPTSTPGEFKLKSRLRSATLALTATMSGRRTSMAGPFCKPTKGAPCPPYWAALDDLWTGLLLKYKDSGVAACQWVLKPAGCLNRDECPDDHEAIRQALAQAAKNQAEKPAAEVAKATKKEVAPKPAENTQEQKVRVRPKLMSASQACAACGTETDGEMRRCSRCKNVTYCDAGCQLAHVTEHVVNCRAPGTEGSTDHVWAMVFPAGQKRKPYAILIPKNGADATRFVAELLRTQQLMFKRPVQGEHDLIASTGVFFTMDSTDEPNIRAQTLFWHPRSPMPLSGPEVKIRGDAIIVSADWTPESSAPGGEKKPLMGPKDSLRDFGMKMYEERWGIFQVIGIPGKGEMGIGTLMPLTPENEKMLSNTAKRDAPKKKGKVSASPRRSDTGTQAVRSAFTSYRAVVALAVLLLALLVSTNGLGKILALKQEVAKEQAPTEQGRKEQVSEW
jgi:hypothetical protein